MIRNSLAIVFFLCILIACANSQVKKDLSQANSSDNQEALPLLEIVNKINDSSPSTFSSSFTVEGSMKADKFKITGTAFYDKQAEKFAMNFSDFVFKSQLSSFLKNGKNIEVHYIPENRIVLDSSETIKITNYVPLNIEFNLVYQLLTSQIPMIENYSVFQVTKEGTRSFLVIQNNTWFQTIAFNSDEPERIKFTNKSTSQEIEIYLRSPLDQNGSRYYRRIRILSRSAGIDVNINTGWASLNKPVNIRNTLVRPNITITNLRR